MAKIERTYNIPLRKEWLKVPRYKRTNKAVRALKAFLIRHMKSPEIKIGPYLNRKIWEKGIKNPPHHVKVNVVKDEKGAVTAELFGAPVEKKEEKKGKKKAEVKEKEEKAEIKEEVKTAEEKEVVEKETKAEKVEEKAIVKEPKAALVKRVKKRS